MSVDSGYGTRGQRTGTFGDLSNIFANENTPLVLMQSAMRKESLHVDYEHNGYYWLLLLCTILFEVCGTICMQLSDGFKNVWPSIGMFAFYGVSFSVFPFALQGIDLSIAYAVWSSCGIALCTIWGVFYANEGMNLLKGTCIFGILICVAGLKYAEGLQHDQATAKH